MTVEDVIPVSSPLFSHLLSAPLQQPQSPISIRLPYTSQYTLVRSLDPCCFAFNPYPISAESSLGPSEMSNRRATSAASGRYSIISKDFCSFENFTNSTICSFAKSQIGIDHYVNNYTHVGNTHQDLNLFLPVAVVNFFGSIHVALAYIDGLMDLAKATASKALLPTDR